ncbi:MAG TPA: hypothetical protein IAD06_09555 [Candidatus Caccoplasma intestinavium]|uniref:Uncharacterized protein n=1 Tax=Candidatus Caccoplasma intestinavium TaxID=2840716 RepID=A0A9D1GGC2_9BACT|nr:hypothetical protein [Candidatus Caccoplasma intestinavium]
MLIFLSYAAMDYFLIEPYEQKRKELWAPRKHKSHFNIDPNRSPKEISDMDYVNRTVTYIAPMPKDTILPPSPVPKLSKEDYLEEPLNLYEDYSKHSTTIITTKKSTLAKVALIKCLTHPILCL